MIEYIMFYFDENLDYTESSVYSRRMHEPSSEHEPNSTTSQPIITSTVVSEATPPLVITMDRPRSEK